MSELVPPQAAGHLACHTTGVCQRLMEATVPKKRKLALDDGTAVPKKKKKPKNLTAAQAEIPAPAVPLTPSAEAAADQPKKSKKKKKSKAAQAAAPGVEAKAATDPPVQANGSHTPAQLTKKEKKRLKKEQATQQAGDSTSIPASQPKAGRAAAAAEAAEASVRAVVGDQGLADSLPPIIKHMYQEAPSVATLSAAVVNAWREERATAIKGCALNPVMTFKEAGAWFTAQPACLTAHPHSAPCKYAETAWAAS